VVCNVIVALQSLHDLNINLPVLRDHNSYFRVSELDQNPLIRRSCKTPPAFADGPREPFFYYFFYLTLDACIAKQMPYMREQETSNYWYHTN
jgi:hypothetical protein